MVISPTKTPNTELMKPMHTYIITQCGGIVIYHVRGDRLVLFSSQMVHCTCQPRTTVNALCCCKPVPGVHYRMNLKDVPFLLTTVSYY